MGYEREKELACLKALELVCDGMRLGLGTGSTVRYFIEHLGKRCREGLQIQALATSIASEKAALKHHIPLLSIEDVDTLDLAVDGADEIDPHKQLIKGAGGALVREKIVASMSKKWVVVADESKLVPSLGQTKLPIEIIPFGMKGTQKRIEKLCKECYATLSLRTLSDGSYYVSDNHNYVIDLYFKKPLSDPRRLHNLLLQEPGVVDTGFFFDLADTIFVGYSKGIATSYRECS